MTITKPRPPQLSVLVVEDNPGDAKLIEKRLTGSGGRFTIEHVDTLAAATARLKADDFDAVVLDLGLPDAGEDVVVKIREAAPVSAIVVLTGLADDQVGAQAVIDGAQDYLIKDDVTRESLVHAIRFGVERVNSEKLRSRLYRADRLASIGLLAAGVAHEINNPAAFLLMNTQTSTEMLGDLERLLPTPLGEDAEGILADLRAMLADNLVGVERIRSTVGKLRAFAGIDSNEVILADLNDSVRDACSLADNEVRHRATLVSRYGELPKLAMHPGRMSQTIVNLLLNAAHALEGQPAESARIELTTEFDDVHQEVTITISDNGCGIPEEDQERIFEPFFTTKPHSRGTGLGLPLAVETIRHHSGRIKLESTQNEGSTFEIRIPCDTGLVARRSTRIHPERGLTPSRGRVLVIDDNALVRRAFARMLEKHHEVTECSGAKKAIGLIDGREFDVILCDLMMPGMDGPAFFEHLSSEAPDLAMRTVFVSGGAFTQRAQSFIEREDVIVLEKPISSDLMLSVVQRTLQLRSN